MSENNSPEYIQYTIQPGDSLWDIADEYNVSVEDLMAANPNLDFNNLVVGQAINLAQPPRTRPSQPTTPPATQPSEPGRRPEERRPEERRPEERRPEFRRPEERRPEFRRPEERRPEFRRPEFFRRPYFRPPYRPYPYRPYPYQPYYPPYEPAPTCPFGATPYEVEPGDSLYGIANRFGLSVDAIVAANPYVNFGIPLQEGQFICLPVGS